MIFQDLLSQIFRNPHPIKVFEHLNRTGRANIKKIEIDTALNELIAAIVHNKKGKALSVARVLLLLLGPEKAIKRIKREGVFRASRYNFDAPTVPILIADWKENSETYGLSQVDVNYLTSANALWSLAPELKKLRRSLIERLKTKQSSVIKTLLTYVDTVFAYGLPGNKILHPRSECVYSGEMAAEAFSYLLHLFHTEFCLEAKHFRMVDTNAVTDPIYENLLTDAIKVCEYLEAEVLIGSFPYTAEVRKGKVTVRACDPTIEKSIRLGYVQSDMQKDIRLRAKIPYEGEKVGEPASVISFAKDFYENLGEKVIKFVQTPVPRYTMTLPSIDELQQIFSGNGLFLEDLSSIEMLGTEDYVSPSQIIDSPVIGNITVLDILKVQRFFYFMAFGMRMAIENHSPFYEQPTIYSNSCLPVFKSEELIHTLENIIGNEKAKEILKLLTCNLSSKYVDLQYTPIINSGDWNIFSMVVLAGSNLVRNILCHNEKRLTMRSKDDFDPMQAALKDALAQAGFLVEDEVDTGTKNNKLEVDILAYRDGKLFIFECKNSFHPCNVYEMRTSFDHIKYAGEQLVQRKSWLLDPKNQRCVFEKLSWSVGPIDSVHTCIAIGNRVFNGYVCDGNPVRQVHELLNVLRRGYIITGNVTRRVWQGENFSVSDLCAYLNGTTTITDLMESMCPYEKTYLFGDTKLTFASYMLDTQKLMAISERKYPVIKHSSFISSEFSAKA